VAFGHHNGVRLADVEGLFPRAQLGDQQDEECPVAPGQWWSLCVPIEHDELLTEQSVLEQQLCSAACQVDGGVEDGGIVSGLRPAAKELCQGLTNEDNDLSREGNE
jgi:hypothetical protein